MLFSDHATKNEFRDGNGVVSRRSERDLPGVAKKKKLERLSHRISQYR